MFLFSVHVLTGTCISIFSLTLVLSFLLILLLLLQFHTVGPAIQFSLSDDLFNKSNVIHSEELYVDSY